MSENNDLIGRFLYRWVAAVQRHPVWVVLAAALFTAVCVPYTVRYLGIDTDTADMISDRFEWRQDFIAFRRAFPEVVTNVLVVVDGESPEIAEAVQKDLAATLEARPDVFSQVITPGAEAFFDTNGLLFLSTEALDKTATNLARVQPFIGRLQQAPHLAGFISLMLDALNADAELAYDLDDLYQRLTRAVTSANDGRFHRLSWQELMRGGDSDAFYRRRMIIAAPSLDFQKPASRLDAMALIRVAADALPPVQSGAATVRLSGNVAMEAEELQSVANGMLAGAIATLILVTLVLYIALRSVWLVCASLVSLLVGLVGTAAFAALAIGHLNLISIAFAILYIGLGISFAIHLCLRYRELRFGGMPSPEALSTAASDVGTSLFLCAATTSFGFYAFIPTDFAGIAELGLISGTGMYISLVTTLTLLPALMRIFPVPAPLLEDHFRSPLLGNLGRGISRHLYWVRAGILIVALIAVFFAFRVEFDSNPLNLRDPDTESVATFLELLDDTRTSPLTLTVLTENRATAARLRTELAELELVDSVRWIESFVPADQDEKLFTIEEIGFLMGGDLGDFTLEPVDLERDETAIQALIDSLATQPTLTPPARELVSALRGWQSQQSRSGAQRTARLDRLSATILGTLPREMERLDAALSAEGFEEADLPPSITRLWTTSNDQFRLEVVPRDNIGDNDLARRFVAAVATVAPHATGLPAVQMYAGDAVVSAFQQAFLSAFVLIALLLYALTRHLGMTIIVLVPLVFTAIATAAAATLLGRPFNFANVITLPLLLGIGVDNGIHMANRQRAAPAADGNVLGTATARAVVFSAATTTVSFGSLAFSAHPGTASMGLLLTVGMIIAVVSALVILPALMRRPK